MRGWIIILVVAGLFYLLYKKPAVWTSIRGASTSTFASIGGAMGGRGKLILVFIVLWEGIFGFYAMSDVVRPAWLAWIPHWGTPTIATAGDWVWANWLPVLIAYGSLMGFLSILSKGASWEKEAKTLQTVASIALAAGFLALPVIPEVQNLTVAQAICQDAGADSVQSCVVNTRWSTYLKPLPGTPNGLKFCYTGAVEGEYAVIGGYSVYRFRTRSGQTKVDYRFEDSCAKTL